MDQPNILFFGGLAFAVVVSAYILWGGSPHPRKKKGHIVGLRNLGSTCFLNTLLQALASCAVFVEWLSQQKHEENSLTSSLHNVLWVLNGQGSGEVHSPTEVLNALKKHGWVVPAGEQDAHELFHIIISTLQDENKAFSKAGSLSDALLISDTLSQTSDILDDSCEDNQDNEMGSDVFVTDDKSCLQPGRRKGEGEGDMSVTRSVESPETLVSYEDASEKLNQGDSQSQSTAGVAFYSLEQDCDRPLSCGDASVQEAKKDEDELTLQDEGLLEGKPAVVLPKQTVPLGRFKSSGERCASGCYDRVTGASPQMAPQDPLPFQGLLTSTLQCTSCGHHASVRYDTFDSLSLPLGESFIFQLQTLQELLRKFVKTEIIPEVDCEKCGTKTTACKTLNFGKLPTCLCLHIARTTWQSHSLSKRDDYVDFPEFLPMDEYTVSATLANAMSAKSLLAVNSENMLLKNYKQVYRLKSVVVHVGGVNSGHFLTYRRGALNTARRHRVGKLAGACTDSQRWYLTSDDHVRASTLCKAMDSFAYMLFYEKCSSDLLSVSSSLQSGLDK